MWNKREKEVAQAMLDKEQAVLKALEKHYRMALEDVNLSIRILQSDEQTQSKIHRIRYQETLKKQLEGILEKLHTDSYRSIQHYLNDSYTDAFVGVMYDLHGQDVPVIAPIDQNAAIKAIQLDTKLSERKIHPNANGEHVTLYESLGVDVDNLKKTIRSEITRGISTGMKYEDIARNVSMVAKAPLARAKTIVRTEGHRIQQASQEDARQAAKARGADVVKQWDSTLDGETRSTHRHLDGQIREVNKPFTSGTKEAMFPGDFGDPAQDCNCRCTALTRARKALDEEELATMKERAKFFGLEEDKKQSFEEFGKEYLKSAKKEAEKKFVPSSAKDLQEYAERILKKHGVTADVEGAGRYLDAATECVDHIDGLLSEYRSTMKRYSISSVGFSTEGGATIYSTDNVSGMRITPATLNSKADPRFKGIPESKKILITTTHEFAHTLSKEELERDSSFWKEIKAVRTKYRKSLKDIEKGEYVTHTLTSVEAAEQRRNIFITDYANKTLDEFMAESFAMAKLSTQPSPYANDVLKIVDKYFKASK